MPLILPGNVASATAGAYEVANSVRMDGSSAYMDKTMGTPTDTDKYTFSFWCKRSKLGAQQSIFRSTDNGDDSHVTFQADDTLRFEEYGGLSSIGKLQTNQVFRDVTAWYHIVLVYDSGNATAGNRMRMYVNGAEVTSFGTDNNPSQDANSFFNKASAPLHFGRTDYSGGGSYFDGYVAEVVMCDGQAYAASDFGEYDSDSPQIWKPKDVSGLTFGTNGFYLDFEDSSNLGNDANGGTDFSESGLAAIDQTTDTPTNNFCTINPLDNYHQQASFSEGNCKITFKGATSVYAYSTGTFGVSAGKWYWEVKATSAGNHDIYGISGRNSIAYNAALGKYTDEYGYYNQNGNYSNASSDGTYAENSFAGGNVTWTTNDIIGIALDMDSETNTVKFYKNNTLIGTVNINAPSTGFYYPAVSQVDNQAEVAETNFGNPSYSLSSAQADANGYGAFEYAPPSGYLALCSKNLGSDGG